MRERVVTGLIKSIDEVSIFASAWRKNGEIMEMSENHSTMPTNSGRLNP
jgi:hypothetical protein